MQVILQGCHDTTPHHLGTFINITLVSFRGLFEIIDDYVHLFFWEESSPYSYEMLLYIGRKSLMKASIQVTHYYMHLRGFFLIFP